MTRRRDFWGTCLRERKETSLNQEREGRSVFLSEGKVLVIGSGRWFLEGREGRGLFFLLGRTFFVPGVPGWL